MVVRELDFQELVETAPDLVAVLDRDHRYIYVNRAIEQVAGILPDSIIGRRTDEVMRPDDAAVWREAVDHVLRTGEPRNLECTVETPRGSRRFAYILTPIAGERVCAVARDVTDVRSSRVLDIAAQTMATGMVIVEAPSGRVLFANAAAVKMCIANDAWPLARALRGEMLVGERVEILLARGERKTVSINATPVRDPGGAIFAAVATIHDVTEARRTNERAQYLAAAGALLEHFDPATSLQAIVDLAVPVLADWGYVHLATAGQPAIVAVANADPVRAAAARASGMSQQLSADTAVARVLAGGPRELVTIDDDVLVRAAQDPDHLARLRAVGYRSAVVAPLLGRDGVLGTVTFSMAESGRHYQESDFDVLTELARRTGIALDNARLFAAEREARRSAEAARDRTRRLQALTASLSGATVMDEVIAIMTDAGHDAFGAVDGLAWLLRGDEVVLAGAGDNGTNGRVRHFQSFPLTTRLPVCDVIRTAQPMMFESFAAITAGYPLAAPEDGRVAPFQAHAVIPFVVGGRGVGAVSFAFRDERRFSDEDREMLVAMMGQASLALERCRLLDAERRARADAEAARQRERELHVLAARLSSALTPHEVATITSREVATFLRGRSAAASMRVGEHVHVLGYTGMPQPEHLARVQRVPIDAAVPMAEAVAQARLVWCPSRAELAARYPQLEPIWRGAGIGSWGAVPFTFEGRTVGSLALAFDEERELGEDEREFLAAVGQLAAQALERARLFEAVRRGEEQLRSALTAAHAATWRIDLATMTGTRDPSYAALLGLPVAQVQGDFETIHPDDRAIARAHFERTLREGVPYEPEVRVRRGDGGYTWMRSHGRLSYGPDGVATELAGVVVDIDEAKRTSLRAEEERRFNDTLHRLGASFASELDHDRLVQLITDEITKLVGAELGAFFYNLGDGDSFVLHTMSAGAVELRTPLVAQTFAIHHVVRVDDLFAEPRAGSGIVQPADAPAVRSYLAVPVAARSGRVFGALLFGHGEAGRFTEQHERLATTIARQAAVALENARLYKDVLEHEAQLETAVERARVADRRKDEFLAMLGHELRNPLAPIATALELMELRGIGELRKERDIVRRQVAHLSRLIDDLLDVSRITGGKTQLAPEVMQIGAVLAKAIEMAGPMFEKRMQRLALDVPRDGLAVDADPTRLAQVFQNLLTNASKYSEPETEIAVCARGDADRVIVEVRDRGIGIAPELMPRLFELFAQGERTLDRAEGGLGIGLTIAKSLCELHGGTIEATSPGAGQGSTFTVTLPRAQRDEAEVVARPPERPVGATARVLVVDDNVDAAQTLHELLSHIGHEPAVAHDGIAALELATTFRPDIALLDIGLPVMDGYELARKLREQLGSAKLRLIAVTGYGQDGDRARAREAGFDHHLVKPIELHTLMALLAQE